MHKVVCAFVALSCAAPGAYAGTTLEAAEQTLVQARKKGSHSQEVAVASVALADAYMAAGRYADAEPLYRRALAIHEGASGSESIETGRALGALGALYVRQAESQRAWPLLERAWSVLEKRGASNADVAGLIVEIGRAFGLRGSDNLAEEMFELAIVKSAGHSGAAQVELARLRSRRGLYRDSQKLLDAVESSDAVVRGDLEEARGDLEEARGNTKVALAHFKRALSIREGIYGQNHPAVAAALAAVGRMTEDASLLARALRIRKASLPSHHPAVADSLTDLGLLDFRRGKLTEARREFEDAITVLEARGKDLPALSSVLEHLAWLYYKQGDPTAAVGAMRRANDVSERQLDRMLRAGSEHEKRLYVAQLTRNTNETLSLHLSSFRTNEEARELAFITALRRKGRVQDAESRSIRAVRASGDRGEKLLKRAAACRGKLSRLLVDGPRVRGGTFVAELDSVQAECEAIDDRIARTSADAIAKTLVVSVERMQGAIPARAALVEIVAYQPVLERGLGPWRLAAFVLRPDEPLASADLGPSSVIDAKISELRQALVECARRRCTADEWKASAEKVKHVGRALHAALMGPIAAYLGDVDHLIVSPDGGLNLIPFDCLVDESGAFLLESFEITYVSSGRDLLGFGAARDTPNAPVVIAAPDYSAHGGKWPPLPATADEAQAVKRSIPDARLLTGAQATEAAVKQLRSPRLLHIATHGFFEDDELRPAALKSRGLVRVDAEPVHVPDDPLLRSGLVLAPGGDEEDGILTAMEVAGLDLSGTSLVVLSACETGLGEAKNGRAVYGLRRSLFLAGAESQVITLWQVADKPTVALMTRYYDALGAGVPRTEALRRARRALASEQATSHPYFWAGFIPSGNWRPLGGNAGGAPEAMKEVAPNDAETTPNRGESTSGCCSATARGLPGGLLLVLVVGLALRRRT